MAPETSTSRTHPITVRRATPTGIITTVAGNGTSGFSGDGGSAHRCEASITPTVRCGCGRQPLHRGMRVNNRIRRVTPGGVISYGGGQWPLSGFSGDGGVATSASLYALWGRRSGRGRQFLHGGRRRWTHSKGQGHHLHARTRNLIFGSQALNNIQHRKSFVTLTNGGVEPVGVTSIARSGTDANQFSQTNNCGIQTQTAVSTACNIQRTVFTLQHRAVPSSAVLTVSAAGGLGSKSVALSGNGGPTFGTVDISATVRQSGGQCRDGGIDGDVRSTPERLRFR